MSRRDLAANVNWFSKVTTAEDGTLKFDPTAATPGAEVELRFEMDTLVLLHTCPHPLDPSESYPRMPVRFDILEGSPAAVDDACRLSAPENTRGYENNRLFHADCGCC
jgi:uncharacterized protein YcgI (DUF1989 family)